MRKRPDSRIVPTRLAQKTLVVIVYDLDLFMTNPGLFCSKETGSSRIIHTPGRLSRIIRAVFVIYLELFVTTPGLFLRERTQKFWNCSCPTLANDSGCYCLWFGIVTTPGLLCAKETSRSRIVHARFCGIIRAVIVHDLELFMTTPGFFLC